MGCGSTLISLSLSLPAAFPYVDNVPPLAPSWLCRKAVWRIFFSSLGQLGAIPSRRRCHMYQHQTDTAALPRSAMSSRSVGSMHRVLEPWQQLGSTWRSYSWSVEWYRYQHFAQAFIFRVFLECPEDGGSSLLVTLVLTYESVQCIFPRRRKSLSATLYRQNCH